MTGEQKKHTYFLGKEPELLTLGSTIPTLQNMKENSTASFKQAEFTILIQRTIDDFKDLFSVILAPWPTNFL